MTTAYRYLIRGQLREAFAITEYRDGCVFKTRSLGYVVMASDEWPTASGQVMFGSVSTKVQKELANAQQLACRKPHGY